MPKVACHSAVYLPWIGYFYKMSLVDYFVILDNTQIMKGGVGNRNYIMSQGKKLRLTVPAKRECLFQHFRDVRIANNTPWRKKHLRTLEQAYAKHPYYEEVGSWLFPVYSKDYRFLIDLNFQIIIQIHKHLGLTNEFRFASDLISNNYTDATERLVGLTNACGGDTYISGFGGKDYMKFGLFTEHGIGCRVYGFRHPIYPQIGMGDSGFVSRLSIIDMLFNCGAKESARIIKENIGGERKD